MINLYYHVKAEIWGNKYTRLGNKTVATFCNLADAKEYAEKYRTSMPERADWVWVAVYKDYGQKRIG
jgi:hypothetical protein